MLLSIPSSRCQVLICLASPEAASRIRSMLSQHGLAATLISLGAPPAEQDTFGSALVVTYTAMIGRARAALSLPVVNVETFIFDRPGGPNDRMTKQFDGAAFMTRVFGILGSERGMTI